jgi:hypothetical protein|uniref:Uncharacterized protein n=1 Tax=Zea mays TaxID=4577 RepID=B4FIA9_MAIZE|nr:unknown [Zea mays]
MEEIHIGLFSSKPDFILIVNSMWKIEKGVKISVPLFGAPVAFFGKLKQDFTRIFVQF